MVRERMILVVATVIAGCVDQTPTEPTRGRPDAGYSVLQVRNGDLNPYDRFKAELTRLGTDVPGFAGRYIDGDTLVVLVTDPTADVSSRATAFFKGRPESAAPIGRARSIRVKQARWSIRELFRYREAAVVAWQIESVYALGILETHNTVAIGTSHAADTARIRELVRQRSIPDDVLSFTVAPKPKAMARLTDRIRPARGGLYVRSYWNECTIAAPVKAYQEGTSAVYYGPGIVTASHCTQTFGRSPGDPPGDSTAMFQPVYGVASDLVGYEFRDGTWFTGINNCPPGFRCRWADAAFIRMPTQNPMDHRVGQAYYTELLSNQITTFAGGVSPFYIDFVANNYIPPEGDGTMYLGSVTGRSNAALVNGGGSASRKHALCFDFRPESDNPTDVLLCQFASTMAGLGGASAPQIGDSGAPVFMVSSMMWPYMSKDNHVFLGIAHHRFVDSYGDRYVIWSALQTAEWDLGLFFVFQP